jgi:hypothetical protein
MPLMPIPSGSTVAGASPTSPAPDTIKTISVQSPKASTVVIDRSQVPKSDLLTHIEGSAWSVDYYSQVIDKDTGLSGQQISVDGAYQQYKLVINLELRVTSPLSQSQDDDSKTMTSTGTALIYAPVIPNEGDMFVASLSPGSRVIFRLTGTTKKSLYKESIYEINYVLNSDDQGKLDDLNSKVINTTYFEKEFIKYGQNPIVEEASYNAAIELTNSLKLIMSSYFNKFISNEFKTLIVPGQDSPTYDHYLTTFILEQFNNWDDPAILKITKLNVRSEQVMQSPCIWTAIKKRDASYLDIGFKRAGLTSVNIFPLNPTFNTIRYTGIVNAVYPLDAVDTVDKMYITPDFLPLTVPYAEPDNPVGILNQMVETINANAYQTGTLAYISRVTVDDYYVLSQDFYDKTTNRNVLETTVWDYLEKRTLNPKQLLDTVKLYLNWGNLEQFYYGPILMTLIKVAMREF